MKKIISLSALLLISYLAGAQGNDVSGAIIDTTGIYGERQDSIQTAVFTGHQAGN